jgi:transposase-like protein
MQRRRSVAERRKLLAEYRTSGMSRKAFCEHHQLALTILESWKRAERKLDEPQLIAVHVESNSPSIGASGRFTLTLAKGRRIESSWQFGDSELARLIRVVESA